MADQRIIHGVGRSPAVIFEEEEKSSLKPLPETRWQIAEWHQCEVRKDWRIMYASAYYSVPYSLIGKTVQIMVTDSHVRVFWQNNPVAMHQRAKNKWEYLRNADHAPPFKEAILTCSKEGLLEQSSEIGPHTNALAQKIFDDPVTDKLRPVRRLLALVVKYGKERLESACKRALHYKTHRYHSVKNILLNCLDQEPITTSDQTLAAKEESRPHQPLFRYARDPIEYKSA